jgi:hypothetical protein
MFISYRDTTLNCFDFTLQTYDRMYDNEKDKGRICNNFMKCDA